MMNDTLEPELKVLTTGILKQPLRELAKQFEAVHGCRVTASWGPSAGTSPEANQVRIRNGEHVDLLLMVRAGMDNLIQAGHFTPVIRKDVVTSRIAVAVRRGHPPVDIGTVDTLRQMLLGARSIGYSEGASGSYVENTLLKKLGIQAELVGKTRIILGQKFVGEAVASGEVEVGIQQLSELKLVSDITILGPLPEAVQHASVVSGAVSSKARSRELAALFLDFLCSDAAVGALQNAGLEVVLQHTAAETSVGRGAAPASRH